MIFDIVTIFPHIADSYLNESLFKRAQKKKMIKVVFHDIRRFIANRRGKALPKRHGYRGGRVDDKPFGGGPGMVIQIEPVYRAVEFIKSKLKNNRSKVRTILFSTRGKTFDATMARRLASYDRLILICGRYEGVDERVAEFVADEEVSVGNYVLSGGELPALIVAEAVARHVPGFLGDADSLEEKNGSAPSYTRPAQFKPRGAKKAWKVPQVLLSGDHAKIKQWRMKWNSQR
jgi:tRNA (guanine37-N1)-methyltransferase